jgi:pimeloyl-ACP methyl ester carboxylesterase
MAISEALGAQQSVQLRQGKILYRERGAGAPIVFLHGALINGDEWRDVVPPLAATHRCIIPDLPLGAHSVPLAPDADLTPPGVAALVAEFLTTLDLRDVTLVASDAGGAIAQILVTTDPSRIAGLVLAPCDTFWGFPPRYLKPLRWIGLLPGMMDVVLRSAWLKPCRSLLFWSVAKRRIEPEIMASYVQPMKQSGAVRRDLGKFFRDTRPAHTRAAAVKLADFDRPTLLVWAADDLWFPLRNARRLTARIPNARLEILANSRTLVPEDQPDTLACLIAEFLTHRFPSAATKLRQRAGAQPPGRRS